MEYKPPNTPPWRYEDLRPHLPTDEEVAEHARRTQNAFPLKRDVGGDWAIEAPEHPSVAARRERDASWIRHVQRYRAMVRNSVPYLDPMLECFKARQLRRREVEALERLAGPSFPSRPCIDNAVRTFDDSALVRRRWWHRLMWWRRP